MTWSSRSTRPRAPRGAWSRTLASLLALGALGALAACGDSTGPDDDEYPPYTLSIRGGQEQSGPAGSVLAAPLEVGVRDGSDVAVKGVPVRFRIQRGAGASLGDTVEVTGEDGVARADLRLGTTAGDTVHVLAFVPGQEAAGVTFRATPTSGPTLREVRPASFTNGDTILMIGQRFDPAVAGNVALVAGTRAQILGAQTDTLLRVVVPPCIPAGSVPVRVEVGTSATNTLTATASASTAGTVPLARFEAITVAGSDASSCLRLAGNGAVYLLVAQLAGTADTDPVRRQYTLSATTGTVVASLGAVLSASPFDGAEAQATESFRDRFDRALRERERELARTAAPVDAASEEQLAPRLQLTPAPPAIGSTREFRVLTNLSGSTFATSTARLRFAGENVLVYEDVDAPAPLTDATVDQIGTLIDRDLYPVDVGIFGAESDIDANGRLVILMTQRVNALTPANECGQGYVAGFFYGFDLSSTSSNSNRGEVYYSIVPDPGAEHSCAQSLATVLSGLPRTFMHEFQHMISYNQHVLVRRGDAEEVWLNEGLSHIAEEAGARYYEQKYPTTRRTTSRIFPDSALPFMVSNIDNANAFIQNTSGTSVTLFTDFGTIAERGAAWLFLRWLGAQKGEAVFSRLVQTSRTSRANVESVAGERFAALFGDFAITVYADSIVGIPRASIPTRYRFGDRTLRAILADRGYGFPLSVSSPVAPFSLPGSVVMGGAAYYRLTVPNTAATMRYAPSAAAGSTFAPNQEAQLGVFRLQ